MAETTPTPTPAPEAAAPPVETVKPTKGAGMDEVFKQADLADAKPPVEEAKADAPAEEPQETKPEEQDAEATDVDGDVWKMRPKQLRTALKDIPSKLRNALVDAYLKVRPYEDSGMRVTDIQRYKEIAPTVEVLEDVARQAQAYQNLGDAISSNTDDGMHYVLRTLFEASPDGTRNLIRQVASNIDKIDPSVYLALQERGIRALIANMRAGAKDNPVLAESARDVAVFAGLERDADTEPEEMKLPDEVEREREELRQMKRQEAARRAEEEQRKQNSVRAAVAAFHESAMAGAYEAGAGLIQGWIEEYARDYPNEVKADLFDAIGDGVVQAINRNPAVQKRYRDVLMSGNGSAEHRAQVIQYLLSQAKSLLPHVAAPVLEREAAKVRGVIAKRQERLRNTTARKDVGNSGSPSITPRQSMEAKSFKGKGVDAVFAAFDALNK